MIFEIKSLANNGGIRIILKSTPSTHLSYVVFFGYDGLTRFSTKHRQPGVDYDHQSRCKIIGVDEV